MIDADQKPIRVCADGGPGQGDYTLCGDAPEWFEAGVADEPHTLAGPGERVTCEKCLQLIWYVYKHFTPLGLARRNP